MIAANRANRRSAREGIALALRVLAGAYDFPAKPLTGQALTSTLSSLLAR